MLPVGRLGGGATVLEAGAGGQPRRRAGDAVSDEATPALHATRRRGPGLVPTTTANRWQDRARQLAVRYVPFLAVLAVLLALVAEAPTTRASAPATPSAAAPSVAGG